MAAKQQPMTAAALMAYADAVWQDTKRKHAQEATPGPKKKRGASHQPRNVVNHMNKLLNAHGYGAATFVDDLAEMLTPLLEDEEADPFPGVTTWGDSSKAQALESLRDVVTHPDVKKVLFGEDEEPHAAFLERIDRRRRGFLRVAAQQSRASRARQDGTSEAEEETEEASTASPDDANKNRIGDGSESDDDDGGGDGDGEGDHDDEGEAGATATEGGASGPEELHERIERIERVLTAMAMKHTNDLERIVETVVAAQAKGMMEGLAAVLAAQR